MKNRRSFLQGCLSLAAASMSGGQADADTPAPITDVHHHIYDSRFPPDPTVTLRPPDATVEDYRLLQKRLGIGKHVIVQPSTYGTDNRCLVDALGRFGAEARGIAVVRPTVSDAELRTLNAAGVRGLRFNLVQAGATTPEMIPQLSKRIADLGWHIQLNATTAQILAGVSMWNSLPVPVVFDHFGRVIDKQSPVFRLLCELMQKRKAWTKLSGVETVSKVGPPGYQDGTPVAKAFLQEAPDRLLWGTNWPHPTSAIKPDDGQLVQLFKEWTPDENLRTKVLVRNPAQLFGFAG